MVRSKSARKRAQNNNNRQRRGPYELGPPIRTLSFTPADPGRVLMRGSFELRNGNTEITFSADSFAAWSTQAYAMLVPFAYFRVEHASVRVCIAGGTASSHSVAFNISNSFGSDTGAVAILNDDYSALATAAHMPILAPSRSYWAQRSRPWYVTAAASEATPLIDCVAGAMSFEGSGGASGSVIVGWAVVEMELAFHTLR